MASLRSASARIARSAVSPVPRPTIIPALTSRTAARAAASLSDSMSRVCARSWSRFQPDLPHRVMKRLLPLVALACMGADRPPKNYPPEYYPYTQPRARWLDRADKSLEWYNLGWQLE